MKKRYGKVSGWGAYTPDNVVTNHDLASRYDTSHEWIFQRTGIMERRFAEPGETTHQMAVKAGRRALARAGLDPADLDLIIVTTTSPDFLTPPLSSQVQATLGARGIPAFQMMTGCSGFIYALTTAYQFIANGTYQHILVIAAEYLSRYLPAGDRSTVVLFGDAAGAVVVEATDQPCGLQAFELGSDGENGHNLVISLNESPEIATVWPPNDKKYQVYMNGREVFKFASRILGQSCANTLAQAEMTMDDIDWILPHQANLRIIQAAARQMGVPPEKFLVNIERYANTSAASVPLLLVENLENGTIRPEDTLLMVAFGAGLTWGSAIVKLQP